MKHAKRESVPVQINLFVSYGPGAQRGTVFVTVRGGLRIRERRDSRWVARGMLSYGREAPQALPTTFHSTALLAVCRDSANTLIGHPLPKEDFAGFHRIGFNVSDGGGWAHLGSLTINDKHFPGVRT